MEPLHIPEYKEGDSIDADATLLSHHHSMKGYPVFILATGHCERGVEYRYIWGAEGLSNREHEGPDGYTFSLFAYINTNECDTGTYLVSRKAFSF